MSVRSSSHHWIDRDESLLNSCHQLSQSRLLALDIEFVRFNTYYPKAALYQLASEQQIFLVDAAALHEFAPLARLLASTEVVKVVHGGGEDMEVIKTHLQVSPRNVFDTQLAASVVGLGWCLGYAPLVNHCLGLELSKHEQRSDWLARPLASSQIRYALQDVAYLLELHAILNEKMDSMGRRAWFDEEMSNWLMRDETPPEQYYLKLGGVRQMRPRQRAVLKALCEWRELEARRRDQPRQWVVRDEHLLRFARKDRLEASVLADCLPADVARRYGGALKRAFATGKENDLPPTIEDALPEVPREVVKEILAEVVKLAEELRVPQELLGKRREIERCVREWLSKDQLPSYLDGWRHPFLSPIFAEKLGPQATDRVSH